MRPFKAADGITYYDYADYLKSALWQTIKDNYRAKFPIAKCYVCKSTNKPVDIHHKHYITIGRESVCDIIQLCRECHEKHHMTGKGLVAMKNQSRRKRMKKHIRAADRQQQGSAQ